MDSNHPTHRSFADPLYYYPTHHRQAQASDDGSDVSTQSNFSSWTPVPRAPPASGFLPPPRHRPPPPPPPPQFLPWPPGGQPRSYTNNAERFREMGFSPPSQLQPMPTRDPAPGRNSPWNGRRIPFVTATGDEVFQDESDLELSVSESSSASDDQRSGQCEVGGLLGAMQRFFFWSQSQRDRQPRNALEESMMCPIQRQIMVDPVVDPDGFSYEREAILKWLKNSPVSPITRRPLAARDLKANRALNAVIQEYMKS